MSEFDDPFGQGALGNDMEEVESDRMRQNGEEIEEDEDGQGVAERQEEEEEEDSAAAAGARRGGDRDEEGDSDDDDDDDDEEEEEEQGRKGRKRAKVRSWPLPSSRLWVSFSASAATDATPSAASSMIKLRWMRKRKRTRTTMRPSVVRISIVFRDIQLTTINSPDSFIATGGDVDDDDLHHGRHARYDRREREVDDHDDLAQIAKDISKRHAKGVAVRYTGDMNEVPQRLLMPSVHDASLWQVRVKVSPIRLQNTASVVSLIFFPASLAGNEISYSA